MGRPRARWTVRLVGAAAVTALCAALLVGCGSKKAGSDDAPAADPSPSSAASTGAAGPTSKPAATASADLADAVDPAHAVPAPGALKQRLLGADLLVYSPMPLSEDVVEQVRALQGVEVAEQISKAQVNIEDQALDIVAVNPKTYRRFTPVQSAQTTDVWKRVAGGEMAILPGLKKKLPTDKSGYLQLGNSTDAVDVHVGAYAPQINSVDAVVNYAWAKDLDMEPGNALLISTGQTSPQSLLKPLQKIVGKKTAVQILGPDLPIGAYQTAVIVGSVSQAIGVFRYTPIGGGRVAPDPAWVAAHITTENMPIIGNMTCNKAIFPQLRAALEEIQKTGLAAAIHPGEYAGCYYPRFIAGTTKLSNHSFGLAFDINTPGNQRGTVGEINRAVVSIFKKWGFAWGGDWSYTDPMHFEMARIVSPK
ncbi:M15 family metallopeptidase [Nocardioides acrostichi]|uniref:M15 family metallopeptidase n=1 Tax=Nocardioides acrostichi TaxID=2784339 RepID=A0A930V4N1_9ACTN|nr:M15 family metallopeptidase [Nocardioides acrostichi]MBF4163680.1 M15 family metallopeptidase [Nocardioides acrostichi]